jgi:tRNA/rRNA methyltransferase
MANFDFKKLILVNPCDLNDDCYARAKHASEILDNALIFDSFSKIPEKLDYLIATSSIDYESDKKHLRHPVYPEDLTKKIFELDCRVGLVFGREDYGLFNEEIEKCDIMVRIPTSEKYSSMNLSHSVAVLLYDIFIKKDFKPVETRKMNGLEKEKLFSFFETLLDVIDIPDHKKDRTMIMFRRVIGRSMPSTWEFHRIMGVLDKTLDKIQKEKSKK